MPQENKEALTSYFQDLYWIFTKRLTDFTIGDTAPHAEATRLKAMLAEIIKVKKVLIANNQ